MVEGNGTYSQYRHNAHNYSFLNRCTENTAGHHYIITLWFRPWQIHSEMTQHFLTSQTMIDNQSHKWNECRLFAVLVSSALSVKRHSLGKHCWKCWQVALRNDTGQSCWSWHRYSWLAFGCEPLPRCTAVPVEDNWLSQQNTVLWMYISRTNTCPHGTTWEIHFSSCFITFFNAWTL